MKSQAADVLVIGSGASGAAFSWSLAKAGFDVVCLEQGKWLNPQEDYATTETDWELHRQTDFNPNPNVRDNISDYPVNDTDSPIAPLMYNAVGGSTIHWTALFPRLKPSDFQVRTLDAVADDWPITYQNLEPYFDLNDRQMGVAGLIGDPSYPPRSPRQMPPVGLGKLGNTITKGFNKLGWHWWPSDTAINTAVYDGRAACNNCGPCDIGCTIKAKASTDVTYWPKAISFGAKLVTGARVREITVNPKGLAKGAVYYDEYGNTCEQEAKVVILACNGIGTPRILLNSTSSLFPNGLANSSGLVGKNLMLHPLAAVTGVFDEDLEGHKGPVPLSIMSSQFYETDRTRGFVRGYAYQVTRSLSPVSQASGGYTNKYMDWGSGHHAKFKDSFNKTVTIAIIGEDLPELNNTVTLDPNITDHDGIPAPKISYRLSDNSHKMLGHGVATATQVMEAAGAHQVTSNPLLKEAGWHLMGTTKMGPDENNSVVDKFGRSHDVRNLFVIDGSIFVTAGAVNPTSTIQALALYIADYVKNSSRDILDKS